MAPENTVPTTIELDVFVPSSPGTTWGLISQPENMSRWLCDKAETDEPRPGGRGRLYWEARGGFRIPLEFVQVDPPEVLAFRWTYSDNGEVGDGPTTVVTFRLEPEGDGTRVRVVETGLEVFPPAIREAAIAKNEPGLRKALESLATLRTAV